VKGFREAWLVLGGEAAAVHLGGRHRVARGLGVPGPLEERGGGPELAQDRPPSTHVNGNDNIRASHKPWGEKHETNSNNQAPTKYSNKTSARYSLFSLK